MEPKDPVKDRDEFKKRIKNSFIHPKLRDDYIDALIDEDTQKLLDVKNEKKKCMAKVNHYLNAYDKAKNEDEKRNVVGSVVLNYEPTAEEISREGL